MQNTPMATPGKSVRISIAVLAAAVGWQLLPAAEARDSRECQKVKAEIRKIQAKMRRGYSAAEGVRLNEKLLKLRERRLKVCR